MSAYIFVAVGGGSIGLLVGGVLTQALNWTWIFFINVPIGVVTFVFGRILIEEDDGPGLPAGLDVLGVNPGHGGVDGLGIYAITQATGYDWASDRTLGLGGRGGASPLLSSWPWRPDWRTRSCRCVFCASGPWTNSSIIRGFLATGLYATFFLGGPLSRERVGLQPHTDRSPPSCPSR